MSVPKPRGKRHIVVDPVRQAMWAETRAQSRRRNLPRTRAPEPGWSYVGVPTPAVQQAVAHARDLFPSDREVDAVLGWLFARFPIFAARGSDMVAHHACLRSDRYYERWVALCARLRLFPRDPE